MNKSNQYSLPVKSQLFDSQTALCQFFSSLPKWLAIAYLSFTIFREFLIYLVINNNNNNKMHHTALHLL